MSRAAQRLVYCVVVATPASRRPQTEPLPLIAAPAQPVDVGPAVPRRHRQPTPPRHRMWAAAGEAALWLVAVLLLVPTALALAAPILLGIFVLAALALGLLHPLIVVLGLGVPIGGALLLHGLGVRRRRE